MNKYFTAVNRLDNIKRYSAYRVNQVQNVSSHSFKVAAIALYIAKQDTQFTSDQMEELLMKAILHDLPEAFTGDIPRPVKKDNENMEEVLKAIEHRIVKTIVEEAQLPKEFKNAMEYCKDGETGEVVTLADLIDCFIYLTLEINSGNKLNKDMYSDICALLRTPKFERLLDKYPSARRLVEHFGRNINE